MNHKICSLLYYCDHAGEFPCSKLSVQYLGFHRLEYKVDVSLCSPAPAQETQNQSDPVKAQRGEAATRVCKPCKDSKLNQQLWNFKSNPQS